MENILRGTLVNFQRKPIMYNFEQAGTNGLNRVSSLSYLKFAIFIRNFYILAIILG